jgi:asparagine synthase (glutamine-hydrolysing)
VACATDLGSLLGLPGVPRRLARRSLHEYLRFLDIAAPNTWFEDVRALEAGLAAHWPADGGDAHAWPAPDGAATAPASFDEAVERLDTLLQRSVRTRLADAARPAAFLSGGVDSALLCALAARQRGDTTAVTVGFEGAAYDEAPVARRIARHLGLAHEVLRFGRADYLAALERYSLGAEQPMADPAVLATVLAFEHCHSRHDIALDGTGADEAVGLLPPRHVRLAVGYASMLPRGARGRLTRWLRAVPGLAAYAPIVDFEHPADTMIRWHGFTRPEIEALCGAPVSFAQTQFYRTFQRFPRHAHFERYGALLNAMPCDRLNQAMLSSGMPVRFPFWDAATDRYLRQLRTDYRYLPGQPKRILRALLARYIPPQIWDGPKHGFNFPLGEFLAADDFALVRRNLDGDSRRLDRILAPDRVQSYARQFIAGDARLTFRIWALVILGAWLEKHDELH